MAKNNKKEMVKDVLVLMGGDMVKPYYQRKDIGWSEYVNTIKVWADEFVNQLKWKGERDKRDFILELESFEKQKLANL